MIDENNVENIDNAEQNDESKNSDNILKIVEYKLNPICRFSGQSFEAFYLSGELFIDFSQKNKDMYDKSSFWNQCKQWHRCINENQIGIMIIQLENKMRPLADISKFKNRYLQYPDQTIHELIQAVDYYLFATQTIQYAQKQYIQQIKQNNHLMSQLFMRRVLFDKLINQYLSTLKQDEIYIASCIGPDLDIESFLGYNLIMSEPMCVLLGKSISKMQEIYQRNGGYNYFDYDSNMEITQRVIKYLLNDIYKFQNLPQFIKDKSESTFQLKFITFDDISFYANVTLKIMNINDINSEINNEQLPDHYIVFMLIDINPNTLLQIITMRQQQNQNEDIHKIYNLEYTLFSEVFKQKMGNLNSKLKNQYSDQLSSQFKQAEYKVLNQMQNI